MKTVSRLRTLHLPRMGLVFAFLFAAETSPATPTSIGVYRWDAYHGGTGAIYAAVKRSLSPAEYHNKIPFFGVVNSDGTIDADDTDVQDKMDQEITYAKNGGVDYWAFLRYCDQDAYHAPMNESYAKYLSSPKKADIKFCWILSHSLHDSRESYWPFEKAATVAAMKDPEWFKVLGNRPLLYVLWDAPGPNLASRLTEIRTLAQSEGLANPYMVGIGFDIGSYGLDAKTSWTPAECGDGDPWYAYKGLVTDQNSNLISGAAKVVLGAHVNWDSRPYHDNPPSWYTTAPYKWFQMPAASQYRDLVQDAVNKTQADTLKCEANTIFVYAWNEFTEGGIMCPTKRIDGSIDTSVLYGLSQVNKTGAAIMPDERLVSNSDFSSTGGWTLYVDGSAGASATFALDGGLGKVTVATGGTAVSSVQLFQQGLFLVNNKTYTVSFKAKASGSRNLRASVHQDANPWTTHWSQTVSLDTSIQTFGEFSFIYTGLQSTELRINFWCGSNSEDVWIDDVQLREAIPTSLQDKRFEKKTLEIEATPNPFNPVVRISLPNELKYGSTLNIYDLSGKWIVDISSRISNGMAVWKASGTGSGVYLIVAKKGALKKIRKVIYSR
ncbi:MAG: carbohydrate binding domain-containing protein [Fibrobacterota bacterium]